MKWFPATILFLAGCSPSRPPEPVYPVPTEAQMTWHRMEMNAFVHFSINTFTDKEWGFGDESPSLFNPAAFDANQWVETFEKAGFKGVILTCKHHDGFCLWPSAFSEHSIKASPWRDGKGDIVRELAEACKRRGLRFGVYVSPWDRNHRDYGTPEYITYYRNQLNELFTSYSPLFEMWFDGANGGDGYYGGARTRRSIDGSNYYDWPATLDIVRKHNPDIIFFSDAGPGVRWVGNERGIAGETNWCTITPDTLYAGKPGLESLLNKGSEGGTHWIPAETDVSIRPGWFYHQREDSLVKSPERLFEIFLTSVGRGSTLLLNIPPDRRGLIHENDVSSLMGFRRILDSTFGIDLALETTITSQDNRSKKYHADNLIDDDESTYWATEDNVAQTSLELAWEAGQRISYVVLQEYIQLGQRIRSFAISAWVGGEWKEIARGTTVGYKRILKFDPITTQKIRLQILDSRACPVMHTFSVY